MLKTYPKDGVCYDYILLKSNIAKKAPKRVVYVMTVEISNCADRISQKDRACHDCRDPDS